MKRVLILLFFPAALSFAESWSGVLVDSKCWINEEHDTGPTNTDIYVNRDRNLEIRFCSPGAKTKSFVLVPPDGVGLQLDSTGNAKAVDLVRNAGKHSVYRVEVTGNQARSSVAVSSISILK